MYEVLPIEELLYLRGDLIRAAHALHDIWSDQQYDYFCRHYVENIESELCMSIDKIERYCNEINVLQCELENLE